MKPSFPPSLCLASMWHCMFSVKSELSFKHFQSHNIVIKLVITFMIYDVFVGINLPISVARTIAATLDTDNLTCIAIHTGICES